jgi:Polyketide cyclase / dehydrase and lipid transport
MARFTSSVDIGAPVDRVWERITDWPGHGRWIPLTTVRVTSDRADGVGATFVGRTGVGPLAFDDPMEIVEWTPPTGATPGHCRIRKLGRVVLGEAWLDVNAHAGGSTVRWTEDVQLAPVRLTRPADRLISFGGRVGFDRVLRGLARELEAEASPA